MTKPFVIPKSLVWEVFQSVKDIHCKSEVQVRFVLRKLGEQLRECGLELHPEKTRIVYCQDVNRRDAYPIQRFIHLSRLHVSTPKGSR
jgi:hypothetical protein